MTQAQLYRKDIYIDKSKVLQKGRDTRAIPIPSEDLGLESSRLSLTPLKLQELLLAREKCFLWCVLSVKAHPPIYSLNRSARERNRHGRHLKPSSGVTEEPTRGSPGGEGARLGRPTWPGRPTWGWPLLACAFSRWLSWGPWRWFARYCRELRRLSAENGPFNPCDVHVALSDWSKVCFLAFWGVSFTFPPACTKFSKYKWNYIIVIKHACMKCQILLYLSIVDGWKWYLTAVNKLPQAYPLLVPKQR